MSRLNWIDRIARTDPGTERIFIMQDGRVLPARLVSASDFADRVVAIREVGERTAHKLCVVLGSPDPMLA